MKKLLKIFLSVLLLCAIALLLKNEFARLLTKNSPYGIQTLISKTASTENLFIGQPFQTGRESRGSKEKKFLLFHPLSTFNKQWNSCCRQ